MTPARQTGFSRISCLLALAAGAFASSAQADFDRQALAALIESIGAVAKSRCQDSGLIDRAKVNLDVLETNLSTMEESALRDALMAYSNGLLEITRAQYKIIGARPELCPEKAMESARSLLALESRLQGP